MRVTTVFNKMMAPLCVTVREVTFEGADLILGVRPTHFLLRCVCGFSTRSAYDRSVRRWRHLDVLSTRTFLQGEIRRLYCASCERIVT
ncbi:MAG: transposase family protein, partial [Acidimicrobiales bacterium]